MITRRVQNKSDFDVYIITVKVDLLYVVTATVTSEFICIKYKVYVHNNNK